MAPVLLLTAAQLERPAAHLCAGESAWETQASWRQVPHGFAAGTPKGTKSAPHHRDFGPGKVGVN